jgi:hypothetical protein
LGGGDLQRIKEVNPSAASGEYDIRPLGYGAGLKLTVYCEMTTSGGGWTRVGFIDETLNGQNSPCVEEDTAYIQHKDLRHKSFAGVWFKNQKPQEMLIHSLVGFSSFLTPDGCLFDSVSLVPPLLFPVPRCLAVSQVSISLLTAFLFLCRLERVRPAQALSGAMDSLSALSGALRRLRCTTSTITRLLSART